MNASVPGVLEQEIRPLPRFGARFRAGAAAVPGSLWVFIAILAGFALMALCAPLVAPRDPTAQNLLARMKAPGSVIRGVSYLLGSDELGRDVLSRIIYGARASMSVAVLAVCLSGVIGTAAGLLAALG